MLVTARAKTGVLSVQQICDHLGVERWVVRRELTLAERGDKRAKNRLRGVKETGPGKTGQAGQWVIQRKVYLVWLGVPTQDRTVLGEDGLPVIKTFAEAAAALGIEERSLRTLVDVNGLDYILVGQNRRYLTAGQLDAVRAKQEETSGS